MRFLFLTDTHLRGVNPANRKDDFVATLKAKLEEVVRLAEELEVTAVLHGGDFFDAPLPGLSAMGEFLAILTRLPAPLLVVPGNHDLHGQNPGTLSRTLLGFLARIGQVRLLSSAPVYFEEKGVRVKVTGAPYHYAIDEGDKADYIVKKGDCDVALHVCHGALIDRPQGTVIKYTLVDEVAPRTEADYTLCGHYHLGYPDVCREGKWFINPGALVRLSASPAELNRIPKVVLIHVEGRLWHEHIPLKSALPGAEVLDRQAIEEAAFRARKREEFLAQLRALSKGEGEPTTTPDIILERVLAEKKEISGFEEVRREVYRIWSQVQAEVGENA
ncbi:metallophosphoesterase family protein [Ammonifex thiophilus]|uniref:Serine/threonine protein phosphatase n=1 Tax=Ammonifex thiophilus TaxID=444093 RepID=A0A3D8P4Q2_9THEO|nr:metallophosphoesterase [Ammonifex thiophilus]RDV83247.1 serine/threonine protein phosphatase [Ammonifex thiophilus]